jgi:transcriptional regulator GlxA family with amidase domain
LAGDLLGSFGSAKADDRVCVQGRVVTCSGAVTAITAACHVIEAELGPDAAAQALAAFTAEAIGPARRGGFRRWARHDPAGPHGTGQLDR